MIHTREKIITKALTLFNEQGIEYVGMRELAAALGMRIGNITYYFPTKDHLVFSLSERYSASNSAIHAAHTVTSLCDFLKKAELLYTNSLLYRSLVLSMVHLMEQNRLVADQYEETKDTRKKGLTRNIKTLVENKYLKGPSNEDQWFLVSAISLINRFWMSEAALSGKRHSVENQVGHYLKLLALLFKPYATKKGLEDISRFLEGIGSMRSEEHEAQPISPSAFEKLTVVQTMTTCGIFLFSNTKQKLLACHATHSRWTQWSIPKGLMMEGEEALPAALRELQEETGIDLGLIVDAKVTSLPPVKYQKQNKILQSFLVITNSGFEDHVFCSNLVEGRDYAEIDSWKWLSLEQAEKSLHEAQRSLLQKIREIVK